MAILAGGELVVSEALIDYFFTMTVVTHPNLTFIEPTLKLMS